MKTTVTLAQLASIMKLMDAKSVSSEHMTKLLASGILADFLDPSAMFDRPAVRKALGLGAESEMFILNVNYALSLGDMIFHGKYDYKDHNLSSKLFPFEGNGTKSFEVCLFQFNRTISSEDAVQLIKNADTKRPWDAAKIEHLLAFGAAQPDRQRKHAIVALGSITEDCLMPCLGRNDVGRNLYLSGGHGGWGSRCRFLAFRNCP